MSFYWCAGGNAIPIKGVNRRREPFRKRGRGWEANREVWRIGAGIKRGGAGKGSRSARSGGAISCSLPGSSALLLSSECAPMSFKSACKSCVRELTYKSPCVGTVFRSTSLMSFPSAFSRTQHLAALKDWLLNFAVTPVPLISKIFAGQFPRSRHRGVFMRFTVFSKRTQSPIAVFAHLKDLLYADSLRNLLLATSLGAASCAVTLSSHGCANCPDRKVFFANN